MFQKSCTFDEFLIKFFAVNLIILFDIMPQKQNIFLQLPRIRGNWNFKMRFPYREWRLEVILNCGGQWGYENSTCFCRRPANKTSTPFPEGETQQLNN